MRSISEMLFGPFYPPERKPSDTVPFVDMAAERNRHQERMEELRIERLRLELELTKRRQWKHPVARTGGDDA